MPIPALITGGGTVGLAAALFLAHHGIEVLLVEQQAGPSIHPRATGVGQRTLELFREAGIEDAVNAVAIDMSVDGLGKISATTLASADLAVLAKAKPPRAQLVADLTGGVSIGMLRGTCPQNRLDPVLLRAARERGATVCYSTAAGSVPTSASEPPAPGCWATR
jgi:putative polyketide hydroxylase